MSLIDRKITTSDIQTKGVIAAPDKLTGTAAENKAIFDRLIRDVVKDVVNAIVDDLTATTGASEIGFTSLEGLSAANVQAAVTVLKTLTDSKADSDVVEANLILKSDKAITNLHFKDISLDSSTGIITLTREDGTTKSIDTVLEKVATNWEYVDTLEHPQSLKLTLADGTVQYVSLSAFITETEFVDSDQIDFSVSNHVVTATIKSGSITESMLSSTLLTLMQGYVAACSASAVAAAGSEANALTYKGAAEAAKIGAETARDMANTYKEAAIQAKTDAETAKTAAHNSETAADLAKQEATRKALESEGHATGTQGGEDVDPDSPYYHNNAKYWAEEAQRAAGGGVTSFNGRSGTVTPQSGDYTPSQVGLGGAVNNSADLYSNEETYSVGDVVIYNNKLYECNTAVTIAETFNPAKWDERTFEELLSRKQDKLNVGGIIKNNALGDVAKAIPGLDYEIGYIGKTTVFNADGTITETFANGLVKLTTFVSDSVITEQYTFEGVSRTKTTTFNADGSITETIA